LIERLWRPLPNGDRPEIYALLDGARDPRIYRLANAPRIQSFCLFGRRIDPALARAAPWIVYLGRRSPVTTELLREGWGKSWGVFVASRGILHDLRRHFRRLLMVKTEDARTLLFRFYDPRVLRVYLPTCRAEELRQVFGPVDRFDVEDDTGATMIEYRFEPRRREGPLVMERSLRV
jgi:hypothetical protein